MQIFLSIFFNLFFYNGIAIWGKSSGPFEWKTFFNTQNKEVEQILEERFMPYLKR